MGDTLKPDPQKTSSTPPTCCFCIGCDGDPQEGPLRMHVEDGRAAVSLSLKEMKRRAAHTNQEHYFCPAM